MCYGPAVCLSVRLSDDLSVTRRYWADKAEHHHAIAALRLVRSFQKPGRNSNPTTSLTTQSFHLLLFYYPGTQFPGNEIINYSMQYKKYKNQAGMNLTPPPPQNSHAVRWHCTAESGLIGRMPPDFLLRAKSRPPKKIGAMSNGQQGIIITIYAK